MTATDAAPRWERAIVVGASSGIGAAIARELAAGGARVALVGRREEMLKRLAQEIGVPLDFVFVHDVREAETVAEVFQQITTKLNGLDLLVYAAGIQPRVGKNEYPSVDDANTIQTNLTGAIAWINQAAERFGKQRTGTIVGISSVAGDRGRRGFPAYQASKAGLDTYLEALRARLAVKGVTVLTAKPGYVRTALTEGLRSPLPVSSTDRVAREILAAAAARKRVVYVPGWWQVISVIVRLIPAPIFERLPIP